ncbi:MAG: molybdenum cofactor guanylyltransferase [Oscillochloris sp.]|nr:molybdenum cofactor guanylyltransferase [Oscillochloris sp.]
MGQDKRRLRLWGPQGPTLLAHTAALATALCPEVLVVLNDPQEWPSLPARLIPDRTPGAGPLAGLASGLAATQAERALVLACDQPLLQIELLRALREEPCPGDALVPTRQAADGAVVEPLLAVYRRTCLAQIASLLASGERRMQAAVGQFATGYLGPAWWMRFDHDGRSFLNLNRPDDLAYAHELIAETRISSC